MKDRVIKRIGNKSSKDKTVNYNCLKVGVFNKPVIDELTPKERKELEEMITLNYT